ncbi:hypothetical protein NB640_12475 [Oxalobacter vibrioformis]|uniref:Uncharacterized protein n=1 Tax=Oxalobacter vibrioformis TaxID=933080 RepID=A0A9E9M024_9BURK|nr:hypothetical protein [Oxalobacter vibrioformis]WAW10013.1 hypothetical protein NB640_12475 [Oxalobacter vibrioformis]
MTVYIFKEQQNINSQVQGTRFSARSLTAAKRAAESARVYQNTVLTIAYETGEIVSVKVAGKWQDTN